MIASSSVEKNVVGSLCAGRSAKKNDPDEPERERRERHAPTEMASIGECDRHRGADATANSPGRQTRSGGRNSGLDAARADATYSRACPPRASCVSTPIAPFALADGVHARALFGDAAMLNLVELEPGAVVPEHSHPHEQLGIVLSGLIVMIIDGEERRMSCRWMRCTSPRASTTAPTPAPEGAVVLDVFVPIREDFRAAGRRRRGRFRPDKRHSNWRNACPSST